jgi:hypothetical protein
VAARRELSEARDDLTLAKIPHRLEWFRSTGRWSAADHYGG